MERFKEDPAVSLKFELLTKAKFEERTHARRKDPRADLGPDVNIADDGHRDREMFDRLLLYENEFAEIIRYEQIILKSLVVLLIDPNFRTIHELKPEKINQDT